uniref:NADH dehydrogenase subunit 5 n=1 Tax=Bannacoris arboreus TaxID=1837149 RepID=UPI002410E4E4|nr:NADH dehydrogenase subunit 5 [Bannacoris arboreus]WEM32383.1 NADH dehydrogenase subunit 5 [Bannacoris arboreus]
MNNLCLYKFWSFILFMLSCLSMYLGMFFLDSSMVLFLEWEVFSLNSSQIIMSLIIDNLSMIFLSCVLMISSMVILYSNDYMEGDNYKIRFLYLILLFILSMLLLIISPNLISILLGWDGLGLVSYCLVIYFQNNKSYNAGMLTILMNRVGDVAILVSIAWMFNLGSWSFIYYMGFMNTWFLYLFLLIVLAAFTKSAQIPFSSWLPAAMAAPTPVSSLVHSSTLVTAGVYLLIRFNNLLVMFDMSYFLLLSCLTMFMAGLCANFEYDLKKIIALSTLSQLGLMMCILLLGNPMLAYFHLLSHAFFKALLFLCAGLMIHCMTNTQDIRHMGGLTSCIPYTCSCFCISTLSLCGIPFMSGFYSKDMILEYFAFNYYNVFILTLFYISLGLTVSYSLRLIYYCVGHNSGMMTYSMFFEGNCMVNSMILLTFMSIMGGSLLSWCLIPPTLSPPYLFYKLLPLLMILLGGVLGYQSSLDSLTFIKMMNFKGNYFGNMWFLPYFSTIFLSSVITKSSKILLCMDGGWGEYLISSSAVSYFSYLSKFNSLYQFNNIKLFLLSFLMVAFILLIMI